MVGPTSWLTQPSFELRNVASQEAHCTQIIYSGTIFFCLKCRPCFKLVFSAHWLMFYSFWF